MSAYRHLVYETPGFVDYFFGSTPISEIASLNIGSRPASRKPSRRIEDLRAIPWSFSWGQARVALPGWYGFGSAIAGFLAEDRDARLPLLRRMNREWPFFRVLLSNIDMILSKTDLSIARHYAELAPDQTRAKEIFGRIEAEYDLAVERAGGHHRRERAARRQSRAGAFAEAARALHHAAELFAD